ncbi:MAG: hypothetical protein ACI8RD_004856 [Bacillariaceae sp.]|jgi:hypothetical protein
MRKKSCMYSRIMLDSINIATMYSDLDFDLNFDNSSPLYFNQKVLAAEPNMLNRDFVTFVL